MSLKVGGRRDEVKGRTGVRRGRCRRSNECSSNRCTSNACTPVVEQTFVEHTIEPRSNKRTSNTRSSNECASNECASNTRPLGIVSTALGMPSTRSSRGRRRSRRQTKCYNRVTSVDTLKCRPVPTDILTVDPIPHRAARGHLVNPQLEQYPRRTLYSRAGLAQSRRGQSRQLSQHTHKQKEVTTDGY